jgi:hypothetical protein
MFLFQKREELMHHVFLLLRNIIRLGEMSNPDAVKRPKYFCNIVAFNLQTK